MAETFHDIDPSGDTLLILHNANAPFALLPSSLETELALRTTKDDEDNEDDKSVGESKDKNTKPTVRMRLSSKHLTLASKYFHKMTASNWKETTPEDGYSYTVNAHDWDQKALLILMNIIHGRTTTVPNEINLETLAKIAVLVDYYQCHDAVDFFVKAWLKNASTERIPEFGERDFMLRLVVCLVFKEPDNFTILTKNIIRNSSGPIKARGLPIQQSVIDALNEKREEIISGVVSEFHSLQRRLSRPQMTCTFECSSIHLGALIKGMIIIRVTDPRPVQPFHGLSLFDLEMGIRAQFKEPSWKTNCTGLSSKPAPASPSTPAAPSTTTTGGLFGGAASSTPSTTTQSTTTTGGLFGGTAPRTSPAAVPSTTTTGGLFGGTASRTPPAAVPSTTTTGGLFGTSSSSTPSTTTQSTATPSTITTGLFGAKPTSTASTNLFGTAPTVKSTSTTPDTSVNPSCTLSGKTQAIIKSQLISKLSGLMLKDFVLFL